ncbi:MarR family EPS-associated transcriptional regulator [Candidatus Pelagibacter sp.]|nr:MarR family EPS-associated transcriptional regulator [Candidatus Pelagibacter sp.]
MKKDIDQFEVLRKLQKKPTATQRELANELNFSLGKLNYCLKALKLKGLVKIDNFQKNKNKLGYIYILTPRGINHRIKLTLMFMETKMHEYDELKKEIRKCQDLK